MKLNVGSGQRRFDTKEGWINVDCVSRAGQVPDIVAAGTRLPFDDNGVSVVTLHHVLEHYGCGESGSLIREGFRVLRPSGSLIVCVPDIRALAQRWLQGDISEQVYKTNLYGAYQGEEGDRHRWGFTSQSLIAELAAVAPWSQVKRFDWRQIPGADIARDWWILGAECIK